jgi:hypothetical protein
MDDYEKRLNKIKNRDAKTTNMTSQKRTERFLKRSIEVPESVFDDLKMLCLMEKTTQRELLANILIDIVRQNRAKIDKMKEIIDGQ